MKKLVIFWGGLKRGGSETAMLSLVEELKGNYALTILCHKQICEYQDLPKVNIIFSDSSYPTNIFTKLLSKVKFYFHVFKMIKYSNVCISSEMPSIFIVANLFSAILKKPLILWNHSTLGENNLTRSKIEAFLNKLSLNSVSCIVNVSHYVQEAMFKYIPSRIKKSDVIYNIIKQEHSQAVYKKKNNIFTIVAIGCICKNKNFELLISSIKFIKDEYDIELYLNIIGTGDDIEYLQRKIDKLELTKYIKLLGYIDNPSDYISNSSMLISSSNSESFGIVVAEALACEVPVISTNTGASEILENGKYGIVVERNNVLQMANAILEVINNYEIAKNKAKLGKQSLTRFSPEKIVPQWIELIESLT
ncbi:MAG TPA: glycosyltransferase [Burkholderiales bacterium]|nr:glycosyltransferase [Burkholderiales bacterium]